MVGSGQLRGPTRCGWLALFDLLIWYWSKCSGAGRHTLSLAMTTAWVRACGLGHNRFAGSLHFIRSWAGLLVKSNSVATFSSWFLVRVAASASFSFCEVRRGYPQKSLARSPQCPLPNFFENFHDRFLAIRKNIPWWKFLAPKRQAFCTAICSETGSSFVR